MSAVGPPPGAGTVFRPNPPVTMDTPTAQVIVLDTNVVLDLLLFADPSTDVLRAELRSGQRRWIATDAMRAELQRVLDYPAIARALTAHGVQATQLLTRFDTACQLQPEGPACPVRCSDRDDQPFIDLAVAHRALLLSKDKAVLRLRRRLVPLGVSVQSVFTPAA